MIFAVFSLNSQRNIDIINADFLNIYSSFIILVLYVF